MPKNLQSKPKNKTDSDKPPEEPLQQQLPDVGNSREISKLQRRMEHKQ